MSALNRESTKEVPNRKQGCASTLMLEVWMGLGFGARCREDCSGL